MVIAFDTEIQQPIRVQATLRSEPVPQESGSSGPAQHHIYWGENLIGTTTELNGKHVFLLGSYTHASDDVEGAAKLIFENFFRTKNLFVGTCVDLRPVTKE